MWVWCEKVEDSTRVWCETVEGKMGMVWVWCETAKGSMVMACNDRGANVGMV